MDPVSHRVFSPAGKFPSHCVAVSSLLRTRTRSVCRWEACCLTHNKPTEPPLLSRRSCRPRNRRRTRSSFAALTIIKGWVGQGGQFHQQVIDIAGNADNGASVDPMSCETTGTGFASLCGVWTDPSFDASQDAVYYARAVENPSCRWSTRQCLLLPENERPDGCSNPRIPRTIQERAWTAPIWYDADATHKL